MSEATRLQQIYLLRGISSLDIPTSGGGWLRIDPSYSHGCFSRKRVGVTRFNHYEHQWSKFCHFIGEEPLFFCINNALAHLTTRHSARLFATSVLIYDVKTFGDVYLGASYSTIRWLPPESSRLVDPVLVEKNRKRVGEHLTRWPMKSVRASALVRGVLHVSSRLDAPRSNSTPQSSPKTN